jgi:hypothetical protein
VDARIGHLRAIDYHDGQEMFESNPEMPFISFVESVT